MTEWVKHDGIKRPVDRSCYVQVKLRMNFVHDPKPAGFWGNGEEDQSNWWHEPGNDCSCDIVEYRVVSK